jgi:lincosamide nucleotidyltransferase A/C/D/E
MRAEDVLVFLDRAASIGATIWLDGGWGVDALLERQTRPHSDLDIAVEQRHVHALEDLLAAHGYRRVDRDRELSWNFVLADSAGHRIDFHVVVLDDDGNGDYGPPENGEQYPAAALTGRGTVAGRSVCCISPEWLVQFHTGYPVDDDDWADVSALCTRFDLPVPADYQRWTDARVAGP